jgi:maleylacetoacetate isomerase
MMEFHGYFRSSAAYRCRIAFNLKQVEYQFHSVHLRQQFQKSAEYTRLNPQKLVPTLVDGDFVLTQSLAIIEWLEEQYPEPPLLPAERNLRAQVRAFAQIIACDIHPIQNLRILQYLRSELGQDEDAVHRWCQRWIGEGLEACEALLAQQQHPGPFCFGTTPGLADLCLVPQIFNAARFGVDLEPMPRVRAVHAACEALPAFANAHPMSQPDAES